MTVVTRRKRQEPVFQQVKPVVTARDGSWPEVIRFVNEQLAEFDLSHVDWFKLGHTYIRPYSAHATYPKRRKKGSREFVHGYRITVSVHPEPTHYPYHEDVVTGTEQLEVGFKYERTPVKFENRSELMVFLVGHEAFHFLRHSKQVPGRNGEPAANRFGLEWLDKWRKR